MLRQIILDWLSVYKNLYIVFFALSSFIDDLVKKAIIPVSIIVNPEIINEFFRPILSAMKPIPISPSMAGISAIA